MKETELRLINFYKKEERDRILSEMEKFCTWLGNTPDDRQAKYRIQELMRNIEFGRKL